MNARIRTVTFRGIEAESVDVEVQIANGMPSFSIVGLPDKAVGESRERVRAALHALGLSLPPKRLTVNLAPADIMKEGSHYDLPIAVGVLVAMEILPRDAMENCLVLGELSLDASIRAVTGVLPAALHAAANGNRLICPGASGEEAVWAGDIDVIAPRDLLQLINHVKGTQVLRPPANDAGSAGDLHAHSAYPCLSAVRGQETAKRALEIAAAGGHNLLLSGPPGSGKSMLVKCLPGLLPPMTAAEALESSMIHSLAGSLPEGGLMRARPFRDPHHSASMPALIGGGHRAKPGEISLAHNGVLFLDELPEFSRQTLESLRQPLESGEALIARANHHVSYPARFQLVAAMNPCRCGYLGDEGRSCARAPRCGQDYQARLSGPLLDRFDLRVDVPAVMIEDLARPGDGEPSAVVRVRVMSAREKQKQRLAGLVPAHAPLVNASIGSDRMEEIISLEPAARELLLRSAAALQLSARGYHRVLRVAQTIADLRGSGPETVTSADIAEALGYRQRHYA